MGIRGEILDDDALQFPKLEVGLAMVLRVGLNIISVARLPFQHGFNVGEHHFLFILHMVTDVMRILVEEPENKAGQIVGFVQGGCQLLADRGQLKIKIIGMTCLQILHKCRD